LRGFETIVNDWQESRDRGKDFFRRLPVYPNSQYLEEAVLGGAGLARAWSSGDSEESVALFYKERLPTAGFRVNSVESADPNPGLVIGFSKGSAPDEAESSIRITNNWGSTPTTILVLEGVPSRAGTLEIEVLGWGKTIKEMASRFLGRWSSPCGKKC
jgi:hypothetical protein